MPRPPVGLQRARPSAGTQAGTAGQRLCHAGEKVLRRETSHLPGQRLQSCLDPVFTQNKILLPHLFRRFSVLRRDFLMLYRQVWAHPPHTLVKSKLIADSLGITYFYLLLLAS